MEDSKQYEIITMASGQQVIATVDPDVQVVINIPDDEEIDRTIVSLNPTQLDQVMKAAETNDIPSATIEENKVNTTENNMESTNNTAATE